MDSVDLTGFIQLLSVLGVTVAIVTSIIACIRTGKKDNTSALKDTSHSAYQEGVRDTQILSSIQRLEEKMTTLFEQSAKRDELIRLQSRVDSLEAKIRNLESIERGPKT